MDKTIHGQKVGILGGGQLGKMLSLSIAQWDIDLYSMDKMAESPASNLTKYTVGDITNYGDVMAFGKDKDILTIEIENINIDALEDLEKQGVKTRPSAQALRKIIDKGIQRDFYKDLNIPQPYYELCDTKSDVLLALENKSISLPFVQKTRKDGYDGKGVQIIRTKDQLSTLWDIPSIIETCVDIKMEVSIIIARTPSGETKIYPAVDMIFNEHNLVDYIICPSKINKSIESQLISYSEKIVQSLKIEGLLAIEFFIDKDDNIFVNEAAPRPHNSGHHSIDGIATSQFEQHFRAILDLPLGNTDLLHPCVTANILGEEGYLGPVYYKNFDKIISNNNIKLHLYGKSVTKPNRKMGHLTVLADSTDEALKIAKEAKIKLKVISK